MLIALYDIHLWYFDSAHLKGTMKELTKIQRQAAIWILGAFKSTPTGAVESLAGLIPIHLQIWKLVYCNHVHMHTLADSHITHLMVATRDVAKFISVYHPSQLHNKCKSLLVDMWANENLVDVFVLSYNKYNVPGHHLTDTCPERITHDIVLIQGKTAKDRAKAREAHLMALKQSFAHSSTSDSCIAIVTNASVSLLSTGYQAVAAWHTWHSDHYDENFRSIGLEVSNDAETNAIGGAFRALSNSFDSISDIDEIHIYSDSTYALHHMLDPSIHSAQLYVLESLSVLSPWMEENANHRLLLHHVFEPHRAVHHLAISTKIEAGRAPARTIAFSTKQIMDSIMSDWANQFQLSQYVGQHFMYSRWSVRRLDHAKAKHIAPLHLNSGTWLKDVGHSSLLIAQMVRGLTSHAPIGHYRKRFKVGNQNESCPHCEGGPVETFQHILFKCLRHLTQPPDMPNFTKATPYWEHFGKFTMDNPMAYAFVDGPAYSQTMDYRTRMVMHWAKGAPTSTHS